MVPIAFNSLVKAGWKSRDEVFDACRDDTCLANLYSKCIDQQLTSAAREEYTSLAALIIEPGGSSDARLSRSWGCLRNVIDLRTSFEPCQRFNSLHL